MSSNLIVNNIEVGAGATIYTAASNQLTFGTQGAERVRINATGYVGINDSSGNARLIVKGDSDTSDADCQIRIYDTDSTAGSQIPSVSFWGGSTEIGRIRGTDTNGLRFYTANSGSLGEKLIIDSTGNIRLAAVSVADTRNDGGIHIPANKGISFRAYSSSSDSRNWRIRSDDYAWGCLHFSCGDDNANSIGDSAADVVLAIDHTRRVGINEVSPDRDLHISNTTPYIRVESTSANQPATLELYHTRGNGSDKWPASVSTDDAALTFNVATAANGSPAEKVRIASDGNTTFKGSGTDVTIKPTDGLIDFGMDGRTAFVTGTNACYIYSGSGASGTIPAGSLVLQARSNVSRDIVFVTGTTPAERFRIKGDGTNTINHPIVFAYAPATTQGMTDATWTKNTWLTNEDIDTDGAFSSSRFTVPANKAGKYYVSVGANLYGNDNNIRNARVAIYKNGSQYARSHAIVNSTSTTGYFHLRHIQCVTSCIMTLAVGDYIENYMYLDVHSGALYMSSDNDTVRANFLMVYRIG